MSQRTIEILHSDFTAKVVQDRWCGNGNEKASNVFSILQAVHNARMTML